MKRTATPNRLGYKSFYRRNLPHIQPLNTALFLTFRLAGSLPTLKVGTGAKWIGGIWLDRVVGFTLSGLGRNKPSIPTLLQFSLCGYTQGALSKLVKGQTTGIEFATLDHICEALNCQPNDIMSYTPADKVKKQE